MTERTENKEDVTKHLKNKARQGASNIVVEMLRQPEIQQVLLRQSVETGLFVSFLIIGVFTLFNVVKQLLSLTWQTDLALAVIFICLFIVYIKKKVKN